MRTLTCPHCNHSFSSKNYIPQCYEDDDEITILIRDCNGNRTKLVFQSHADVLHWADDVMTEEDEVLYIAQGGLCVYSGLQSDVQLTCDDITGFFA